MILSDTNRHRDIPDPEAGIDVFYILDWTNTLHHFCELAVISIMDDFSWSDSFKAAVGSCFSCLHTPVDEQNRNSLEGLLADAGETDNEAETLSLHTNPGDRRRKKRKRAPKSISIFGYNVFGKPPIRLEGEDSLNAGGPSRNNLIQPTISTSTLDSDAAPLDPSVIAGLSTAQLRDRSVAEEEERRQKDERKQLRRERKALKRASLAMAMNHKQEQFEGFPGSVTATYENMPTPYRNSLRNDDFIQVDHLDADEDGDFEAGMYTARAGNQNRTGSDSRSRTSASMSNSDLSSNPKHTSQQPGLIPPPTPRRPETLISQVPAGRRKSKRSKTSSSKTSSSKTSQSSSLMSPVNTSFPTHPAIASQDQGEFEGFPVDSPFPSAGLGGGKRISTVNSEMGVALARRGDD